MNVDYKLIGNRIKSERKKLGFSQEILAEKIGVSIGYVSQVERGITKISLDLLASIASALSCNIASLISESAYDSNNYLKDEFIFELQKLNMKQRRMVLDFIKLLYEYK